MLEKALKEFKGPYGKIAEVDVPVRTAPFLIVGHVACLSCGPGLVDSLFGHYQVPFRQPVPEHDDGAEGKTG